MFKTMLETCLLYLSNHIQAISAPLKSVSNSCSVVLEPLTHKTADLNGLKHSFALALFHLCNSCLSYTLDLITLCMYVTGQICFQYNFDLTYIDFQLPMSPSPTKQRILRINLGY